MDRPFIKLFHTPNSGYFYDVGKNEIVRIPENVYQHLSCVVKGTAELDQSDDEEICEMIESFKDMGYLSTRRPKKIQHSATAMIPLLLDRCIDKITLQLTQDCNFRCKYCIYSEERNKKQRSHAHKSMPLETAKEAILFYRNHSVDSNMINIGFYGGEPILEWNLLQEIVLFAEEVFAGKLLSFTVTSNASLLTDSMMMFLEKHNIGLTVSLDGINSVNDINRVFGDGRGTTDTVIKRIKMIKENYPKLFKSLRISSVIDPEMSPSEFGKYPCELESLPLGSYTSSIEDNTDHDVILPNDLRKVMENEVFHALLSECGLYSRVVSPYGYGQIERTLNKMKTMKATNGIQNTMAPGGPCVPGRSRLFVSVEGNFYPCERVNETPTYCIGNLKQGFDIPKISRMLNVGSITEDDCRNCWAIRNCTICAKYFDYLSEDAQRDKLKYCNSIRENTYQNLRMMILLHEMDIYYKRFRNRGDSYEQSSTISSFF